MKKILTYSVTGAIALALVAGAAPVSANIGADVNVQTSAGVRIDADRNKDNSKDNGLLKRILNDKDDKRLGAEAASSLKVKLDRQNASTTSADAIAKMKTRANQEIDRRVASLTKLSDRVKEMKRISDSQKASLSAAIQVEINNLTSLKAKIAADTDVAVLRADIKNITTSHRIYALIMPQIAIMAAADRVNVIVAEFATLATKLQTRIDRAQAAGKNVNVSVSALADLKVKTASATANASAAVTAVASLTPDNGDNVKAAANRAALKSAQEKIRAAHSDLKAARKDAETVIKETKGFGVNASSTASTTVSR